MNYWFENEVISQPDCRQDRLKRIAVESQLQDEGQIERWLDLAKKALDRDDDPNSSAA